mgnify:CR=1 FL=1
MESWTEKTNPLEPEFIITLKELSEVKDTVETLKKISELDATAQGYLDSLNQLKDLLIELLKFVVTLIVTGVSHSIINDVLPFIWYASISLKLYVLLR